MKNLPVISTVMDAYAFVWDQRRDFLYYAFLPVLIGALAQALLAAFLIPAADAPNGPDTRQPGGGPGAASLIGALLTLVLYVMFAVAWHRRFLVEEQTTIGAALRWGPRHMRFLGRFVLLGLVLVPFVAVVVTATPENAGVVVPLSLVLLVATILVYSRLLLIFPAIAVDERLTVQGSWQLTRGLGWRMVGIWILPLIPISVVSAFVSAPLVGTIVAFGLRESVTAIFVAALVNQIFVFAGIALTVSALSIAYRDLKAQVGATSTALTPSE